MIKETSGDSILTQIKRLTELFSRIIDKPELSKKQNEYIQYRQ